MMDLWVEHYGFVALLLCCIIGCAATPRASVPSAAKLGEGKAADQGNAAQLLLLHSLGAGLPDLRVPADVQGQVPVARGDLPAGGIHDRCAVGAQGLKGSRAAQGLMLKY